MKKDAEKLLELADLDQKWVHLGLLTLNEEGKTEQAFLHFPAGASQDDIWKWLDGEYAAYSTSILERWQSGKKAEIDEVERSGAHQEIADSGYCGFIADGLWRCIGHTIECLNGEWTGLLKFAIGQTTELPDGVDHAWHDDSSQYITDFSEYSEGIHCEVIEDGLVCGAEIYPADESWDDEEEDEDA